MTIGPTGMLLPRAAAGALVLAALTASYAAAQAPSAPGTAVRPGQQYTIEQFMETTALRDASFSADGTRLLFSSNKSGIFNAYSMSVQGGEPTQITTSTTDTIYAVAYFPKDDRILYTRDQGGNELNHLFVRTPDGQEKDLTPGEKLKARFMGFARDDDAFHVATNERDPRFFDVYRYDAANYARVLLYRNDAGYFPEAIAGNGGWLALVKPNTTNDSDIYVWNAATNEAKHISAHEGTAWFSPKDFDPAGAFLYYTTNSGSEWSRVRRYDLRSGSHEDVEQADWDIEYTFLSRDGRYRVTGINEDGRTALRVVDTRTSATARLPHLPAGAVSGAVISRDEKLLAFYVNGDRAPSNLYIHRLGTQEVKRLTSALSRGVDAEDLVEAQVVRFKSFDGTVVPSIYFKPHQATPQNKAPAIVYVHGGPGGQTKRGYNA